jgi:hypothetical protein
MGNLDGFDANNVEPQTGFEPIPVGKYPAIITESEMKATKSGEGEYLQLTFEVVGEQYKGRRLWARLNLKNKNETAVKIAQAELSAICRAVGVMTPSDSSQLHNIPLQIDVGMEKNKENGEMTNRLKGYHPAAGAAHSAPVVAAKIASAPPTARPAWAK